MNWQSIDKDAQPIEEGLVPISDVVSRTGLSARTLRYYEELGLLPGVRRRAGGRRVYGEDELERLAFMVLVLLLAWCCCCSRLWRQPARRTVRLPSGAEVSLWAEGT